MESGKSWVSAEYLRKAALKLEAVKNFMDSRILQANCKRVLDIGCGPGIDTVRMALASAPDTFFYGIDHDPKMIEAANAWAFANGIEQQAIHQTAEATHIPFEAGFFDGIRSDRVFQHLTTSQQTTLVLQESLRVLRKGGIFVVGDADWASASLDYPHPAIERKLLSYFTEQLIPNAYAGRQLYRLFKENGLKDVEVKLIPVHFDRLVFTPFGEFLTKSAKAAGFMPEDQLNQWLQTLQEMDQEGIFFCSMNMVVVSGIA